MSFAWNRDDEDVEESPYTYYNLPLAKSAFNALRRLHDEVTDRTDEIGDAWSQPMGDYVESDADDESRALVEAYWDCALTLWDCVNRQINALNVGEEQTIEDSVRDIGFALKTIDLMGLADW